MIDPSALEGDDLVNWYRRSPVDVEAEREAARQDHYNAFVASIDGASKLDDGSRAEAPAPSYGAAREGTQDAAGTNVAFNDGDTGLMKARYFRPPAASVMAPPSGFRVGPSLDTVGAPPTGASASGFFGRHNYSSDLGGYYNTDLPSPLNFVMSTPTRWWELGDGRLVQADEVERIYAEQRRRLKGQEDAEPASRLRVVDKWKDGQIPPANQVQKGERELDPTCAPNGGWERDPNFASYSDRTKRYETQITRAPGLDYVVRNPGQRPVKFDGCDVWDPGHPLLEAKGPGYASLLPKARQWGFYDNMFKGAQAQAVRQAGAARNYPIEWHIAEPGAFRFFNDATTKKQPPIALRLTAPR